MKRLFSNHNDWELNTYTAFNTKTKVLLWTANGSFFFDGYNGSISFGLLERHIFWYYFNNMRKRKALGFPY